MMLTVSVKNNAPSTAPTNGAAAAGQRGAAQDRRSDAGQRVAGADDGVPTPTSEPTKKPAQHGNNRGQKKGAQMDEIDAHAIALGRLLAKADGPQLQAAAGAIQPEVAGDRRSENDHEERNRNKADAGLKEVDEIFADHAEGRRPQIERDALNHAQHGDGGDDRIDADVANESAVGQADHDADREADQRRRKGSSPAFEVLGNQKGADTTVRLITAPTETSKPRTINTLNCAMVTSASGAVASRICRMLSGVRNTSVRSEA